MKRLLIFPFDLLAHYTRCIKLAEQYKEQYEILFLYSKEYNHLVLEAGYDSFECDSFDADEVMSKAKKFDFSWLNYSDIKRIVIDQAQIIMLLQPDLIIADTMPTIKIASEISSTPCNVLMNAYMSKYYDDNRTLSKSHSAYWFMQLFPNNVSSKVVSFLEAASMKKVHNPFKKLRAEFKLKHVDNLLSEIEGDQNLICDDTDIFPVRNLPENYQLVGPLISSSSKCEESLIKGLNPSLKTITVCMGSSGNWSQLAFLNEIPKGKYNIIACGNGFEKLNADHIHSKPWINLDQILPITDLLICHAGNGTVYKGIEHGCKMLFSTNHFEQEWNAHRFEATGYGVDISNYKSKDIQAQIETMLEAKQTTAPTRKYMFNYNAALWN